MKRFINLLSLFTLCVCLFTLGLLFSCSPTGWHVGTGDKMNNLREWKQDCTAKKDAKKARQTELVNR